MSQELVDSVNTLTSKTTQLLNEYVNAKTTIDSKVASAKADAATASQKAEQSSADALSSAGAASRAEAAAQQADKVSGLDTVDQAVKSALDDSYQYAMTKAEFDALQEERKHKYAGSGFIEWGKHNDGIPFINQGISSRVLANSQNAFYIGRKNGTANQSGISKTAHPVALVNGIKIELDDVGFDGLGGFYPCTIRLPEAEIGTRTYNSRTGEVKQFNTPAEAVDGMMANHDFRDGQGTWEAAPDRGVISVIDGVCTLTDTTGKGINEGACYLTNTSSMIDFVAGRKYRFEVIIKSCSGNTKDVVAVRAGFYDDPNLEFFYLNEGVNVFEWECGKTISDQTAALLYVGLGNTVEIKSYSVHEASESVIKSRKDLVFLETWYEKVSDKDIVCPLGNTQYGSNIYKSGISCFPLTDYGIEQGYCAFGDWDTATIGKGNKWSLLTTAQKKAYLDDPCNNLFFDTEINELIQVRYRVRVIRGLTCKLLGLYGSSGPSNSGLSYLPRPNANFGIFPQGQQTQPTGVIDGVYDRWYTNNYFGDPDYRYNLDRADPGLFTPRYFANAGNYAHEGKVGAIMIAAIQRMTQGAYHPSHCPEGCNGWRKGNGDTNSYTWDQVDPALAMSPLDCYKALPSGSQEGGGGNWGGEIGESQKRPDQYAFHDGVYAGQVEDLRLSAHKMNLPRLLEDSIAKAVSGGMRGKQLLATYKVKLNYSVTVFGHDTVASYREFAYHDDLAQNGGFIIHDGNAYQILGHANSYWLRLRKYINGVPVAGDYRNELGLVTKDEWNGKSTQSFTYIPSNGNKIEQVPFEGLVKNVVGEFDSMPFVNLIGSPERIATTFQNGVIGEWIGTVPTGEPQSFKLTRKAANSQYSNYRIYTHDDGATWSGKWDIALDPFGNKLALDTPIASADIVCLLYYATPADFTAPQANSEVLTVSPSVFASSYSSIGEGNRLAPSVCGTIMAGNVWQSPNRYYTLESVQLEQLGLFGSVDSQRYPAHKPIDLPVETPTDAFKVLPTITQRDGMLYLQLHGRNLKYGNNSWGDDHKIPIVNNEGSLTDLNGNDITTFCHHCQTPLGIADSSDTTN